MDDERLIEYVRQYELYNAGYSISMLGLSKDRKWAEIAAKLGQPLGACKARWNNIRDNFRKSRKKRSTITGPAALRCKKYKFEDQLGFLVPFLQEREERKNSGSFVSRDEQNDDEKYDTDDQNTPTVKVEYEEDGSNLNADDDASISRFSSPLSSIEPVENKNLDVRKSPLPGLKTSDATSSAFMKYMLEQGGRNHAQLHEVHPVDAFLAGIAPTLKSLSPYHLNLAKSKIFNTVQEIEMDQIMNTQQKQKDPFGIQ